MPVLWNIALPVFGIIFAGYLVGWLRLLGEGSSRTLNGFAYWVALLPRPDAARLFCHSPIWIESSRPALCQRPAFSRAQRKAS